MCSLDLSSEQAFGGCDPFFSAANWGAILIPVFQGVSMHCLFFKDRRKGFSRKHWVRFFFLCTALLFGLFQTTRIFQGFRCLLGYLGQGLAVFLTREIGARGTTLLAVALLILSATLWLYSSGFCNIQDFKDDQCSSFSFVTGRHH